MADAVQSDKKTPSAVSRTAKSGRETSVPANALSELLARPHARMAQPGSADIVVGRVRALGADGQPFVDWPAAPQAPTPALSLAPVCEADIGRNVALGFPAGTNQPLILGFVWQPETPAVRAEVDGENLEIQAQQSITLRCGQASITLTADGQVLVRGTYVSSHASGTQRIKGAAVRIN